MGSNFKPYVVRQGDHVDKLALLRGADGDEVWNDASNDALRAKRATKDVLYPGDVLHLPDTEPPGLSLEKGSNNRFTARIPRKILRVALLSDTGPYANAVYEIRGLKLKAGATPPSGTTDANGVVEVPVPILQRELGVLLPAENVLFQFAIGDVDPMDEATGPTKRLENLGYLRRGEPHDDAARLSATQLFQRDNDLEPSGRLDAETKKKLAEQSGQSD
ncbi:MAG: hypothetical protein U0414_05890 [Polyangiaceae bacterium]